MRSRWDLGAVAIAAVPIVMLVLYVRLIQSQGNDPLVWVVVLLAVSGALALVSASPRAKHSSVLMGATAVPLLIVGLLGILSIGLPLLLAGSVAIAKAMSRREHRIDVSMQ